MIISHKHKFIFLKTVKTGGTSTELALSPLCGPEDVLTPLMPSEEHLRNGAGARNYQLGLGKRGTKVPGEFRRLFPVLHGFYNHIPARHVRALVGEEVWNSYFKFTIVRNPWDRQVSYYFWHTHTREPQPDFDYFMTSWVERTLHRVGKDNWPIYAIGNRIAVDHVIRYENLKAGLAEVFGKIGITTPPQLPRAKGATRTDKRHYREFYNDKTKALVARWYEKEIAAFGYEF